jgi:hypothetical protein
MWLVVLAGCAVQGDAWEGSPRVEGMQASPGSNLLELTGPTVVASGETHRWTVSSPYLAPGVPVTLGWGPAEGAGICPWPRQTGGNLCLDIVPANRLGVATAVPDGAAGTATFDIVVPSTGTGTVFLQAMARNGFASATTNTLAVGVNGALPPGQLAGGLVGFWTFENGNADDVSGNDNHATPVGGSFVQGQVGDAISLGAGEWLRIDASPDFGVRNQVTVAAWVRPTDTTGVHGVFVDAVRGGGVQDFGLYVWGGEVTYDVNFPRNETVLQSSGAGLQPNVWTHIAGVYDFDDGEVRFYVDGAFVSSTPVLEPLDDVNSGDLGIGTDAGFPHDFLGELDEVGVWSRALTDAEIAGLVIGARP